MRRVLLVLLAACNTLTGTDTYKVAGDGEAQPDAGPQCAAGTMLCPTTQACVTSCAACDGGIDCIACTGMMGQQPRCYAPSDPSNCTQQTAYTHCACKMVADCPGGTQACVLKMGMVFECRTCGEPGTDGQPCKGGMACDATAKTCTK